MTKSRSFLPSTLVAVMCVAPLLAEAASLQQIPTASVGGVVVPRLNPEQIQRTILQLVEQEMSGKVRAVHAVMVDPVDPIKMPSGSIDLKASPNGPTESLGRRTFHVQINMNGKPWRTIDATADISASIDAVVPTRVLQTDSVIDAEDVAVHRVKLTDLDHQMITNVADVIGKSAARPLQTNNPIRLGMVKKPYVVRKGDRVSIEARHGGLSIQTVGVTKASGELGQSITVANLDSGKELRAKVVGPGAVRVEY
jgi:flagellar basal body P-ring formation protein FlgA